MQELVKKWSFKCGAERRRWGHTDLYLDTLKNRLPLPTHRVPENPLEKQQKHGLYPHRVLLKCTFSLDTSEGETTKPNQDLQPGGKKANLLGLNQHTAGYRREKKKRGRGGRWVVFSPQPSKQTDFAVVLEQFALCWEEESSHVRSSVYSGERTKESPHVRRAPDFVRSATPSVVSFLFAFNSKTFET